MDIKKVAKAIVASDKEEDKEEKVVNRPQDLGKKEIFLRWEAKARVGEAGTTRKLTRSLLIIGVVVALFLIIMQEFFLILVVASAMFVSYVLSTVPSESSSYELSSHGVLIDGIMHYWNDLHQYFFTEKGDNDILAIDQIDGVPIRLFLTIHKKDKAKIKDICDAHLSYLEEEPKDFINRSYENILDKFDF